MGARFVDFGGWDLPVMYTSIVEETEAVRSGCGLFDVSHMGRFFASGQTAQAALDHALSRDLSNLPVGRQRYSLLLNEEGGILDDLMAARVAEEEFMLVVNAGNRQTDWEAIRERLGSSVDLIDRSDASVMIALQGPESERVFRESTGCDLAGTRFLDAVQGIFAGMPFIATRSGYTGEDGFEFILPIEAGMELWRLLSGQGVKPCGLGARDMLRLEVAYPLYGHELTRETLPTDVGLEWALSKKNPYIGKEAVETRPSRFDLAGFVCEQKAIPRAEYGVEVNGVAVGMVTSGGLSSRLANGFGLARVSKGSVQDRLDIVIRGKRVPALRVPAPFIPDRVKR
jgi:aminomethyltransferase